MAEVKFPCPRCRSLRLKLFAPLVIVFLALLAYVQWVWTPQSIQYSKDFYHRMQDKQLVNIGEGLVPLILADQLAEIHASLDAFKRENPDWLNLELFNAKGQRLYPLAPPPAPANDPDIDIHQRQITLEGHPLGLLRVTETHRHLLASIRTAHRHLLLVLLVAPILFFVMLAILLEAAIIRPMAKLAEASHKLAEGKFDTALPRDRGDEVGELINSFAAMREEIRQNQTALRKEIHDRQQAEEDLIVLNNSLEERVREELAKNRQKDLLLIQQSRLAAMGEMVHNIAHQWRQPLNALALVIRNIKDDYEFGELGQESLDHAVNSAQNLLNRMSTTIDDFRDFFRPDQEKKLFNVADAVRQAANIMEASYRNNHISLEMDLPEDLVVDGFPSQYSQAVLNILANAKEIIQARKIDPGLVRVRLEAADGFASLTIEDNAGGIADDVLPKVFDPYFTTKEQGSGIGLYMTKMIIERNMEGHVTAANSASGARFTMAVPLQPAPDKPTGKDVHDE
ncbi:MAG: sensor histidine kinase [Sulfuricellaceae bacterium]|jgi:signal transduction histidine kinase